MNPDKKKKSPMVLFINVFAVLAVLVVVQNLLPKKAILLPIPDNAAASVLETISDSLVCVFQDGRTAVWDWKSLPEQKGDFNAVSDRAIVLDSESLAAVSKTDQKILTIYALPYGQKQKEFSVGWKDQDIWIRISFDRKVIALIRQNPVDQAGKVVYEFLIVDIEKELLKLPTSLDIQSQNESLVDYAVDGNRVLYAVGSKEEVGRIAAVDLLRGKIAWDIVFSDTKEFRNVAVSPDNKYLLAGNRDGVLYKLDAETGKIVNKIQLLEEGETRPVTNDYSVLNLAFSSDGQYFVTTINPKAYFLRADTDKIIYRCSPVSKLVSKITFSPENQFFVASDVRVGYPLRVLKLPGENSR